MLYDKLKHLHIVDKLNSFLRSKFMVVIIALLAGISNIFNLELPVYYIYALIVILTVLFSEDMLPTLPIAICGYMTFSKNSNPHGSIDSTFSNNINLIQLIIIAITIGLFAITRVIYEFIKHKERRNKPKLLLGYIILLITSLLGGLFTDYYGLNTIFFGLIQTISISFTYFLFYYSIDWEKVKKERFMFIFLCVCILMLFECLNMYIDSNALSADKTFNRDYLFTGWGINNNIAIICVTTLPAPFYYINTKKKYWPYILLALLAYLNLFMLQSRNGILFGTITFIVCTILTLKRFKDNKHLRTIYLTTLAVALIVTFIEFQTMENTFASLIEKGLSSNGRFIIYEDAIKTFIRSPIFGEGFYSYKEHLWTAIEKTTSFIPARFHNTWFQQLASCGILGLLAYCFHRFQTIKLFNKNENNIEIITMKVILTAFILMCILDCHFHNLGPGLIYSAILLFIEKVYTNKKETQN